MKTAKQAKTAPFWERKTLAEMTDSEWESLCDGCALCCLHKVQDEDTEEVFFTDVACRLLDLETCRCTDYANRSSINPDCVTLSKENLALMRIMPSTCAYRRTHERRTVILDVKSLSVCGKVVSEDAIAEHDLEDRIVDWISVDD